MTCVQWMMRREIVWRFDGEAAVLVRQNIEQLVLRCSEVGAKDPARSSDVFAVTTGNEG